jgi:hypothetical protein
MSESAKVGATASLGVTSAANRAAASSRFSSADRVEGLNGGNAVGTYSQWRPGDNDSNAQGGFNPYSSRGGQPLDTYTPFTLQTAALYRADGSSQDIRASTPVFLSDLMRGIGIYEFNMRIFAGTQNVQGSVINRYS